MNPQLLDISGYALNTFSIPPFVTSIAVLFLGIAVLFREHFSQVSITFLPVNWEKNLIFLTFGLTNC
jgi:hypothetical protein